MPAVTPDRSLFCKPLVHAVALALAGIVIPSFVQADDDATSAAKVEKIEVTGSSIKHIAGQTALPVQVIDHSSIEKSGATSAAELLSMVSANTAAFSDGLSISDSATQHGFNGASLRGLGAANTLVLLNGRRLANYAFNGAGVDLGSIPLGAIDRVEVLKDGASAIYGTDAIGGVINFILKKNFTGGEVTGGYGNSSQGGGQEKRVTVTGGYGDLSSDGYNVFASLDYKNTASIAATDRDFSKTAYIPSQGVDQTSQYNFPANIILPNGSVLLPSSPACQPPTSVFSSLNGNYCRYDYQTQADILPPTEKTNLIARGTYALNADQRLFVELTASHERALYEISPPYPLGASGYSVYPANGPYYPTGLGLSGDLTLAYRPIQLGSRSTQNTSDADRIVIGSEGTIGEWDYNTAFNHAESKSVDRFVGGYASASAFNTAFSTGLINPFGPSSPQGTALLLSTELNTEARSATGTTDSIDGKVTRELMQLDAGPVGFALGGEVRHEKLNDTPSAILQSGDVLGATATAPTSGGRSVVAMYSELEIPVTKSLETQLALRDDHYSDFGNTINPKIGMRWQIEPDLLARASYGTGFRAPTLPDLYSGTVGGITASNFNDPRRCVGSNSSNAYDCNDQFPTITGGNPNLQPEKSKQYSFGFFFEPSKSFSGSVDYWSIFKRDVITTLPDSLFDTTAGFYQYESYVHRSAPDAINSQYGPISYISLPKLNYGSLKTDGVDLELAARTTIVDWGRFEAKLSGTYVDNYEQQVANGGPYYQIAGDFNGVTSFAIPRWRSTLTLDWTRGPDSLQVTQHFQSHYWDQSPDANGNPRHVGDYETYDMSYGYSGIKHLKLNVGVKNLFNTDPPFSNQFAYYLTGYDPTYADPRGRFYYGSVTYSFK